MLIYLIILQQSKAKQFLSQKASNVDQRSDNTYSHKMYILIQQVKLSNFSIVLVFFGFGWGFFGFFWGYFCFGLVFFCLASLKVQLSKSFLWLKVLCPCVLHGKNSCWKQGSFSGILVCFLLPWKNLHDFSFPMLW